MRRMTGHDARRALAAALALALLSSATAGAQGASIEGPPASPEKSFVSGKDIILYPPDNRFSTFRFLPKGPRIPFDRSLDLSASVGESRLYLVQVDSGKAGQAESPVIAYRIDKRRPLPPKADPGTGLYEAPIEPRLSGEEGADIYWALIGPEGATPAFVKYDEASRPRLAPPSAGTETYTLIAYSVDPAGNRGYPARFVYRLAEPGLDASAPVPDSTAIAPDASIPLPDVDAERGYSELKMSLPSGSSLLLDVNPDFPPASLGEFERVDPEGGIARLRLPCPYAWSMDLKIYFGLLSGGVASYNPQPLSVHISNPADEIAPIPEPEVPTIAADPAGRGAFAIFPSYGGTIYVSVDGAEPSPYTVPVALPPGEASAIISWYGKDESGQVSGSGSQRFPLPSAVPDIPLGGIADGAVSGSDVALKPLSKGSIRYELRLDGSLPPEPTLSSPLLGESLPLSCAAGEELSVAIRYRSFEGEAASEGRILRFTLDRKPPGAPRPSEVPPAYSDKALSISLLPGSGARDLFVSASADGADAPFAPVKGPIALEGSDAGPVKYVVRAYDVDIAGNRSQEMKSLSFVVDRSSVYVADDGSDNGDGTPDRPFRSFDSALAEALKAGKRNLNIRGTLEMRVPAQASTAIDLVGGFGKLWESDPSARADLRVAVPRSQAAFTLRDGLLRFRHLDVEVDASGSKSFIAMDGSALALEDSSVSAGADGDYILVSAGGSKIELDGSRIEASRGMVFTAFSCDGSDISLSGSSISAAGGVSIFGAFAMGGGTLSLRESLLESHADLSLNLMSLRSASLLVDRSLIEVDGGSGYLRLGSFDSVEGEVKNSKIAMSWKGPGVLFEISNGGPAFMFDTIVADSGKDGLRFFDSRGYPPQVWNSILDCAGQGSELMRSDTAPGPGLLVADCLWGFDTILSGAIEAGGLAPLNALNAGSALYSSKPSVAEPPERSFVAQLKSGTSLRADSACVKAALPLGKGYEVDFSGRPRTGPDIGADELGD